MSQVGHYTALKVESARLTGTGSAVVKDLHEVPYDGNRWERVADLYPHYPFLREWSKRGRCDFIPFGSGWVDAEWSLNEDLWSFVCCLKNYEGDVEYFIGSVLPNLIDAPTTVFTKNDMQDDYDWKEYETIVPA